MKVNDLQVELRKLATPQKAKASGWFFKTKEGEYGYGDKFLGVTVPEQRRIAKKFQDVSLDEIKQLLESEYHEERLTALFILVGKFEKAGKGSRSRVPSIKLKVNKPVMTTANGHNQKIDALDSGQARMTTRNDIQEIFEFYLKKFKACEQLGFGGFIGSIYFRGVFIFRKLCQIRCIRIL